jgi:hypothetical protein
MGVLPHDITLLGYEIWIMNICHIVCRFCLSLAHKMKDRPISERRHELTNVITIKKHRSPIEREACKEHMHESQLEIEAKG